MYILDGIYVLSFGGIVHMWTLMVLGDYMWYIWDYGVVFNIKYVSLVLMYSVIGGFV